MKYLSRRYKVFIAMPIIFIILAATVVGYEAKRGNFHAITLGEAYRSAQLDRDGLDYYVKKYRIKSILNLRGGNPGEIWYADEIKFSAENDVRHYDIALSAYESPREEDIRNLMDIFMHAPRPLLIHCQAGADRSGLVAAMWKLVVDKEPKTEATKQLSIFYGHLSIGKASAMDDFFRKWTPLLNSVKEPETAAAVLARRWN